MGLYEVSLSMCLLSFGMGTMLTNFHIDGEIPKASNSTFGNCSGEGKNCPIL